MTTSPLPTNQVTNTVRLASADELAVLYNRDYFAWIEATLQRLQQQDYSSVDWNNLIEEIADMGRSEKRSLESNLVVVLLHLLKWQYQSERRSKSWAASIAEHRRRIRKQLKDSPSLKPFIAEELPESYADSVKQASIGAGLSIETFPMDCPYAIAQVLDENFLPDST
ncbi:MAG: DUF29 domain-containing protein [Leptolyngbya foveolarum]|uniref:DUF29 domain-containing protein n=1 Tax=Leptolyngbya foveolarum TaxID=47253 RepID=A0A2W4WAH6_9CYAN|nr:MAG: DUF29 domain-containing protein [Leptolyngbya foveolarum]